MRNAVIMRMKGEFIEEANKLIEKVQEDARNNTGKHCFSYDVLMHKVFTQLSNGNSYKSDRKYDLISAIAEYHMEVSKWFEKAASTVSDIEDNLSCMNDCVFTNAILSICKNSSQYLVLAKCFDNVRNDLGKIQTKYNDDDFDPTIVPTDFSGQVQVKVLNADDEESRFEYSFMRNDSVFTAARNMIYAAANCYEEFVERVIQKYEEDKAAEEQNETTDIVEQD